MSKHLAHYGIKRRSGRYPWGSGEDPYQGDPSYQKIAKRLHEQGLSEEDIRNNFGKELKGKNTVPPGFHNTYNELRRSGKSEVDIANMYNCTVREIRRMRSISTNNAKIENIQSAVKMKEHGYSNTAIAEKLGTNESTVRNWLSEGFAERTTAMKETAKMLDSKMKEAGGYIDISAGSERELGVSKTKFDTAVKELVDTGKYETLSIRVKQVTMPNQYTTTKLLVPKGTTPKDVFNNMEDIHQIENYSEDGGKTYWAPEYPRSMQRSRILVRYNEEGGVDKDGVIELRRNVPDLDLKDSTYAQVRIAIEGNMYAKGMAVYSDDIPDGYDMIVNTNRHLGAPDVDQGHIEGVFKKIKNDTDADLAFGAKVKANGQYHYEDENGDVQLGLINKVNEEGDWQKWSKTLSSQFLAKQDVPLIRKQLNKTYAEAEQEFNDILQLTNPAVKEQLLSKFADTCDGSAVDLQAVSLPRQQQHVILPINSLKENEIYAPNYRDGEEVVLVRYPHEGTFEIPRLIVNNKNAEGKKVIGPNAKDAVGINHATAEILSGADFDGDTVAVIPTNGVSIKTSKLEGIKGFEPKEKYGYIEGMKVMQKKETGMQMGMVSNLITDMTLKGATPDEIACATRHAMVVIDAAKHKLNYEQSYVDNRIAELKTKYQGGPKAGAATLISRASARKDIEERQLAVYDEETGKMKKSWKPSEDGSLQYMPTGRQYKKYLKDKNGDFILDDDGKPKYVMKTATEKHKKMEIVDDAHELSSGTVKEGLYADYANSMKALANRARKEAMSIEPMQKNSSAAVIYKAEVQSLMQKLDEAKKNAPRERAAQISANIAMKTIREENPGMTRDELKKISQYQITKARASVGANKKDVQVKIEPREWEAIQAGALSTSKQKEILSNCDLDVVRQYATPRKNAPISTSQINSIKNFSASGFTNAEISERLGISASTVSKYIGKD